MSLSLIIFYSMSCLLAAQQAECYANTVKLLTRFAACLTLAHAFHAVQVLLGCNYRQ